jgi:hypothetical protein
LSAGRFYSSTGIVLSPPVVRIMSEGLVSIAVQAGEAVN